MKRLKPLFFETTGRWLMLLLLVMCSSLSAQAEEAYACYTSNNTTLTFYYDNLRSSRTGTTYDLFGFYPYWYNIRTSVTRVVFDPSFANARPTSGANWFNEMTNLQSITGTEYLNTSSMTDMNGMFYQCSGLTTLDVSHFDTANSTDMGGMFYGCSNVGSLDVSHFNTKNVTNMWGMFRDCSSLTTLDLGSFNITRVTAISYMFNGCSNLTTIYVGGGWYSTGSTLQEYDYIFTGCTRLVGGNGTTYSSFNMDINFLGVDDPLVGPGYMTGKCYAVYDSDKTTLTFYNDYQASSREGKVYYMTWYKTAPEWYRDNNARYVTQVVFDPSFAEVRPTSTYYWFYEMRKLSSLKGMEYLNTSEVTNMSGMFYMCLDLTTICVGDAWSTDAVIQSDNMFYDCPRLVGGMGTTYDESHVDHAYAHIDGGPSDPGYFTEKGPEAYACYTPENTTLTFYYDKHLTSRPGTTYDLNTGNNPPEWYSDSTNISVTQVVFDPSFAAARPTTTYRWFSEMSNLLSITGMEYLNTSEVTNMFYMFHECRALPVIDLSNFNTANVRNMSYMFQNCRALTSLDLSSFNTANVGAMGVMFYGCTNLTTIYASEGWTTDAVTGTYSDAGMFIFCNSLVGGQGTAYNSSHVDKEYARIDGGPSNPGYFTDINAPAEPEAYVCYTSSNTTLTFCYDNQRSSRPGSTYNLNTGNNQPEWIIAGTNSSVTRVVIEPSFADVRPTSTYAWFLSMDNLQSITGMEYLNTSEVTKMGAMFAFCPALTSLDVSHFNTANVTDMFNLFSGCSSLTSLDVSGFNTANVTDMRGMFANCNMITSLDLSSFNTAMVRIMNTMFMGCSHLTTIYAGNGWNTDDLNYSYEMFYGCTSLMGGMGTTYDENHVDVSYAHLDGGPSNPGYFSEKAPEAYVCYTPDNTTLTFYYDGQRNSRPGTIYNLNGNHNKPTWVLDGTNSSVTRVVFDPSFAGARPTITYCWFNMMKNLESITGMEYLNTSAVTNMTSMFSSCSSLTELDVSHFNTENVVQMEYTFSGCSGLTTLDLSSFNILQVEDMQGLFYFANKLVTIYVGSKWNADPVRYSSSMFYNCSRLVGGQGTTYNSSNPQDKTYAHIDGGPSNPGYFTAAFMRGDVNGDGNVNIADVTALIDYLLSGDDSAIDLAGADCNQDDNINIADVTALIDHLLSGSWE